MPMSDGRPSPEHLLERWKLEEGPQERGRLKLFFGAVAGVGKTFAMLQAAHELKSRGVDVVIGWIETHGRKDTEALLEGLERLPARALEHRETALSEFDLIEVGDYAALNIGSVLQTHLFEDRIMKSSYVRVEAECSVGNHAVVLYDTLLQSGSKVAPLSLVMKGEILPPSTRWAGIPIGAHQG